MLFDTCFSMFFESLDKSNQKCRQGLPVPPPELRIGYGDTIESYLEGGKKVSEKMIEILQEHKEIPEKPRILDFGCAAGRMLRWLKEYAEKGECWGADIRAGHIVWCKMNLAPPFHFFVNTTIPHLPFPDGYFDLIYAGSVFTHIDDMADTWLLELRRITRPDGCIYITFHDDHTLEKLANEYREHSLAVKLRNSIDAQNTLNKNYAVFSIGRDAASQVFYRTTYLIDMLSSSFDLLKAEPGAYGYQTAYLLRKK
jgi:ubiquinone/menaquinone biosynthesis C-methylase UbiE